MAAPLSAPASSTLPHAGVLRRLAALVYDGFLLFGLLVVPLLVARAFMAADTETVGAVVHDLPPLAPAWMIQFYAVAIAVGFYVFFWRRNGQTLGMQAWRMQVQDVNGGRPRWGQCLLRAAVGPLSLLCAGLGYFWLWWDSDRATWHDRVSGTRVVVLPKRRE